MNTHSRVQQAHNRLQLDMHSGCHPTTILLYTCMQVRERLDEVLAQVDLTERFNELVGVPGVSGLPTEARKRLTIAVELMANPPVIFMDEPTSGVSWHYPACVVLRTYVRTYTRRCARCRSIVSTLLRWLLCPLFQGR